MPDVSVEFEQREDGHEVVLAKISADEWEINVRAPQADFAALSGIRDAAWATRSTRSAGTSAGSPVFWCRDEEDSERASVLVGADDETWDIAISLPTQVVEDLVRQVAEL
jgi:hypothetical protein